MKIHSPIQTLGSILFAVSLVALAGSGCGNDPVALAPFEPEVVNVADSFSLQATGVTGVTTTVSYTWSNSGTRATIDHSTTTDAGSTSLVVKDGSGATVYSKDLSPSLNEATAEGAAGNWTIVLTLSSYKGTINFTAQKL